MGVVRVDYPEVRFGLRIFAGCRESDEGLLPRGFHGSIAVRHIEFHEHCSDVILDCPVRNEEAVSDLCVRETFGQ